MYHLSYLSSYHLMHPSFFLVVRVPITIHVLIILAYFNSARMYYSHFASRNCTSTAIFPCKCLAILWNCLKLYKIVGKCPFRKCGKTLYYFSNSCRKLGQLHFSVINLSKGNNKYKTLLRILLSNKSYYGDGNVTTN